MRQRQYILAVIHQAILSVIKLEEAAAHLRRLRHVTMDLSKVPRLNLSQHCIVALVLEHAEVRRPIQARSIFVAEVGEHAFALHALLAVARELHRAQIARIRHLMNNRRHV